MSDTHKLLHAVQAIYKHNAINKLQYDTIKQLLLNNDTQTTQLLLSIVNDDTLDQTTYENKLTEQISSMLTYSNSNNNSANNTPNKNNSSNDNDNNARRPSLMLNRRPANINVSNAKLGNISTNNDYGQYDDDETVGELQQIKQHRQENKRQSMPAKTWNILQQSNNKVIENHVA